MRRRRKEEKEEEEEGSTVLIEVLETVLDPGIIVKRTKPDRTAKTNSRTTMHT